MSTRLRVRREKDHYGTERVWGRRRWGKEVTEKKEFGRGKGIMEKKHKGEGPSVGPSIGPSVSKS